MTAVIMRHYNILERNANTGNNPCAVVHFPVDICVVLITTRAWWHRGLGSRWRFAWEVEHPYDYHWQLLLQQFLLLLGLGVLLFNIQNMQNVLTMTSFVRRVVGGSEILCNKQVNVKKSNCPFWNKWKTYYPKMLLPSLCDSHEWMVFTDI